MPRVIVYKTQIMPCNGRLSLGVVIGGVPVPEYYKDGLFYVESNLFTPFSYEQEVRELAFGEIEIQKCPVTPYEVRVDLNPCEQTSWLQLIIDGVVVESIVMCPGTF